MDIEQILANFSLADQKLIDELGISHDNIREQLGRFQNGFPPIKLVKNASLGEGVRKLSIEEENHFLKEYDKAITKKTICKFVPASGAASRMFRSLFAFLNDDDSPLTNDLQVFFDQLQDFAFYHDLANIIQENGGDLKSLIEQKKHHTILQFLLTEKGLNYGNLPKALLKFHQYDSSTRTAAEEHLIEGAAYGKDANDKAQLHFTVSENHIELFKNHFDQVIPDYEKSLDVSFHYETSIQNPATNTIAVTPDNQPFRKNNDGLVFRPGGHGALLENLNLIDADFVYIKNVDNVVPDYLKGPTTRFKKLIGGVLYRTQEQIFAYLGELENGETGSDKLNEIAAFLKNELCIIIPSNVLNGDSNSLINYLKGKLNRPIRVVGLITTDSNTGGGPFWAEESDGTISLQVVETAQINADDPTQKALMETSSYANITDLVCGLNDYQDESFDLMKFRDPDTGFISDKSLEGRDLRALELPGLWNGSMADWNTVFVEVPRETFNPVKTVMDLLGAAHQPSASSN